MWLWILTACSRAPTARDMAYAVGLFDVVSQATVWSSPGNHTVEPVVGSDPDDTPWQGQADLWLTTSATPSTLDVRLTWKDVLVRRLYSPGWDPNCDGSTTPERCAVDEDPVDFVFSGDLTGTMTLAEVDVDEALSFSSHGPDIEVEGILDGNVRASMTITQEFWGDGDSYGTERQTAVARIDGADVGPFGWELVVR